jgi:uncharacterized membrane protein
MKTQKSKPYWQAISLGILAGMRTFAAPVVVSQMLIEHPSKAFTVSPLKFMRSKPAATGFAALAVGECVGDKLPFTPNRIEAGGVIGRCLSGGLAGATIFRAHNYHPVLGALIGSSSALLGTFGSYFLRKGIVKQTKIADPYIGAAEDLLAITIGAALIRSA